MQQVHQEAPLLIAPECYAPGCHHDGDQYSMVKCSSCGHWFCAEHIETNDENRGRVALVESGLRGLAYYEGRCPTCREQIPERHPVDSTWLR